MASDTAGDGRSGTSSSACCQSVDFRSLFEGMHEYWDVFERHHLCPASLEVLKSLTESDLRWMGVASVGHQKLLLLRIRLIGLIDSASAIPSERDAVRQEHYVGPAQGTSQSFPASASFAVAPPFDYADDGLHLTASLAPGMLAVRRNTGFENKDLEIQQSSFRRYSNELSEGKRLPNSYFLAFCRAMLSMSYLTMGNVKKEDVMKMNSELSLIGSLVWLVQVSWVVEKWGDFSHSIPADEIIAGLDMGWWSDTWNTTVTLFLYLFGIGLSCTATLTAIVGNMVLLQIRKKYYGQYMARIGNRLQHLSGVSFLWGGWCMMAAWMLTTFSALRWPYNAVVTFGLVPFLVGCCILIWTKAVYIAYEFQDEQDIVADDASPAESLDTMTGGQGVWPRSTDKGI